MRAPSPTSASGAHKTPRDELIELHQRLTPQRLFDVLQLSPTSSATDVLGALAGLRARAKEHQRTGVVDAATVAAVVQKVQEIEKLIQDPVEHHVLVRAIQDGSDPTNRDIHRRFEASFLEEVLPLSVWRRTGELAADPRMAQRFPVVAEATVEAPGISVRVPTDELSDGGVILVGCPIEVPGELRVLLHLQGGIPVAVRAGVAWTKGIRTRVEFKDVGDATRTAIKEALRQYDANVALACERLMLVAPESTTGRACAALSRFFTAANASERAAARKALAQLEGEHGDHLEVQLAVARAAVDSGDRAEAQRVLRLAQINAPNDARVEALIDVVGGDFAVVGATVSRATRTITRVVAIVSAVAAGVAAVILLEPAEKKEALTGVRCVLIEVVEDKLVCHLDRGEKAPTGAELREVAQRALVDMRAHELRTVLIYDEHENLVGTYPPPSEDGSTPPEPQPPAEGDAIDPSAAAPSASDARAPSEAAAAPPSPGASLTTPVAPVAEQPAAPALQVEEERKRPTRKKHGSPKRKKR